MSNKRCGATHFCIRLRVVGTVSNVSRRSSVYHASELHHSLYGFDLISRARLLSIGLTDHLPPMNTRTW